MELLLNRRYKGNRYTIGKLYIDGEYIADTLEDIDRGLTSSMPIKEIMQKKVYGDTAIPTGTYKITLDVVSPKFSKYQFYKDVCKGKLPRLLNVPGFDGILLHVGDGYRGPDLTFGCILVGKNKIIGGLLDGKETFKAIWNKIKNEKDINITII